MAKKGSFVLLPKSGFLSDATRHEAAMRALPHVPQNAARVRTELRLNGSRHEADVLHSISETGPKLIEMDHEAGAASVGRDAAEHYRLFHVLEYGTRTVKPEVQSLVDSGIPKDDIEMLAVQVADASTGAPVEGARVVFSSVVHGRKLSLNGTAGADGVASVPWVTLVPTIQICEIWPPADRPVYWGVFRKDLKAEAKMAFAMKPVQANCVDCVRALFPSPSFDPASGVTVGVIDTGVAAHVDLNLVGGLNTVTGEKPADYTSNGDPHGTHVAGLVGASGPAKGTAPGVKLRGYRVFGEGQPNATNFAILHGLHAGITDQCDILNISLGVQEDDKPVQEAIDQARNAGALVVAAGNNNSAGPVGPPASYPDCIGVSAMGRMGTIPAGSLPDASVSDTRGSDSANFLASFTSVGPEVDFIGPGVGAVSTIPDNAYGQLSGTSMACPVVAGCAASLLAGDRELNTSVRDRQRSDALAKLLGASASSLGFTLDQQGAGLPSVAK